MACCCCCAARLYQAGRSSSKAHWFSHGRVWSVCNGTSTTCGETTIRLPLCEAQLKKTGSAAAGALACVPLSFVASLFCWSLQHPTRYGSFVCHAVCMHQRMRVLLLLPDCS